MISFAIIIIFSPQIEQKTKSMLLPDLENGIREQGEYSGRVFTIPNLT